MNASDKPPFRNGAYRHRVVVEQRPEAVRDVRHWLENVLWADCVDGSKIEDVALVVSELVANAVHHARPGAIEVVISASDQGIDIDVTDAGGGDVVRGYRPPGEGALGLRVVEALVDGWSVDKRDDAKTVHAHVS